MLRTPIEIQVGGRSVVNADISQSVEIRPVEDRFLRLLEILGEWYERGKVLVFVSSQDQCDNLFRDLLKVRESPPAPIFVDLACFQIQCFCKNAALSKVHWGFLSLIVASSRPSLIKEVASAAKEASPCSTGCLADHDLECYDIVAPASNSL